ncbi:hypothetical protein [Neorhizobium huautlense]|nr:hypothetical protein [Neorhizobium huautlense]
MQKGRIVEYGSAAEIFGNPREPYTRILLDAVPTVGSMRGGKVAT